jgi:hypothetical protein
LFELIYRPELSPLKIAYLLEHGFRSANEEAEGPLAAFSFLERCVPELFEEHHCRPDFERSIWETISKAGEDEEEELGEDMCPWARAVVELARGCLDPRQQGHPACFRAFMERRYRNVFFGTIKKTFSAYHSIRNEKGKYPREWLIRYQWIEK